MQNIDNSIDSRALIARIDALEHKVSQLENARKLDKIRRFWLGGLTAVLGLTVLGVTAKAAPKAVPQTKAAAVAKAAPGLITCTGIKIIDTDGKPRVEMGVNDVHCGYIVTESKIGAVLNKISSDADGKGDMQVESSDGRSRVEFGCNPTDSGFIATYGTDGNDRSRISTDKADNGGFELMGTNGKDRVFDGVNPTGSGFSETYGKDGNTRSRISTDGNDKGSLELMGLDGKDRIFANADPTDSGQITTYGTDGNERAQIGADASDAGIVHVMGKEGKDRVVLTNNAKTGVGQAQFDDSTGAVKKTVP